MTDEKRNVEKRLQKFQETAGWMEEWRRESAEKAVNGLAERAKKLAAEVEDIQTREDLNTKEKFDRMMTAIQNFNFNLPTYSTITDYLVAKAQKDILDNFINFAQKKEAE